MAAQIQPLADGRPLHIRAGAVSLEADLQVPDRARGLVIFAHGSGSSRHSPRNRAVAATLQRHGLATLLADLLTSREEEVDAQSGQFRFDIDRLGRRVIALIDWAVDRHNDRLRDLPIGLFGASTGAAAALVAAAARPRVVKAVVSRGGRPDLSGPSLASVHAPTLLLVGSLDTVVINLNREAAAAMPGPVRLQIVAGATHLFQEPGTLDEVAREASHWFTQYCRGADGPAPDPAPGPVPGR